MRKRKAHYLLCLTLSLRGWPGYPLCAALMPWSSIMISGFQLIWVVPSALEVPTNMRHGLIYNDHDATNKSFEDQSTRNCKTGTSE